ncbi:O-antigen ligase family protein [Sphingomonas sp. Leaf4]|uniref:O-antigen ligase family protein n=1 Tax=Sphingomonas sp. Leaf4 TaxID=2876553 RepID=UPI001E54F257|nr:O-antigen ligase family protein [Sphingomonas sp. Leaf4]
MELGTSARDASSDSEFPERKDDTANGNMTSGLMAFRVRENVTRSQRMFMLAVWMGIAAIVYREAVGNDTLVFIGSYNLTTAEIVLVSALGALAFNFGAVLRGLRVRNIPEIILVVILTANLLRGLTLNPMAAIVSVRGTGPLAVYLLLTIAITRAPRIAERTQAAILIGATLVALLCLVRHFTGLLMTDFVRTDGRMIGMWGALLVAIGCTLLLSGLMRGTLRRYGLFMLLLLLVSLILTAQGTGIVCGMVGMAIVFAFEKGLTRSIRMTLFFALLLLLGIVIVAFPNISSLQGLATVLPDGISQFVLDRDHTSNTRKLIWQGVMQSYENWPLENKLFGFPSGSIPFIVTQEWGGVVWENSVHSMYFQTLIIQGVIGVVAYVAVLLLALGAALLKALALKRRTDAQPVISFPAALALVINIVLFGYSYDFRGELSPLLMLGLGAAWTSTREQRSLPQPVISHSTQTDTLHAR